MAATKSVIGMPLMRGWTMNFILQTKPFSLRAYQSIKQVKQVQLDKLYELHLKLSFKISLILRNVFVLHIF